MENNPFPALEIVNTLTPVSYPEALATMTARVNDIQARLKPELIWFLEHPPLYTAGTRAHATDLKMPLFPVYETGRGGQYTYHGPGQLIVYVMVDLKKHQKDLDARAYVSTLLDWSKRVLDRLGVISTIHRGDRIGVWVDQGEQEKKIVALGVRLSRWVTSHGFSLNIAPDLTHYRGIVPCGLNAYQPTSLTACGVNVTREHVVRLLIETCPFTISI